MYVEKYHHTYCDKYGNTYRISLRQLDYEGPAFEVEAAATPWTVERENASNLKIGGVFPTRATAVFIGEGAFTLQELYSGQEDTYQLVRLKNGVINWIGFVVPDGFVENGWDQERPYLTVKATDNLSLLKGVPFTDIYGENYGNDGDNIKSFLWVIKEALKKTGILLPIRTLVDLKSIAQATAAIQEQRVGSFINEMVVYFTGDQQGAIDFLSRVPPGAKMSLTYPDNTTEKFTVINSNLAYVGGQARSVFVETTPNYTRNGISNVRIEIESEPQASPDDTDPLDLTDHDVRVWIRDTNVEGKSYYEVRGGALNTYDILAYIASQWNVAIYQNEGRWEVKRINVDKVDAGDYRWFNYTADGVFLGRIQYGVDTLIPCKSDDIKYRIFGSTLGMDRVLKNAIVNYRFKYRQGGDSLVNMIVNGDLDVPYTPLPRGWVKVLVDDLSSPYGPSDLIPIASGLPSGKARGAIVYNRSNMRTYSNLTDLSEVSVNKGDKLYISWYEQARGLGPLRRGQDVAGVYGISVFEKREHAVASGIKGGLAGGRGSRVETGKVFELINNETYIRSQPRPQDSLVSATLGGSWRDTSEGESETWRFVVPHRVTDTNTSDEWIKVELEVDEVPTNGFLKFEILGAAVFGGSGIISPITWTRYYHSRAKIIFPGAGRGAGEGSIYFFPSNGQYAGVHLAVTGFEASRAVDPDNEIVPQIDPFMYPDVQAQLERKFTDTIEEIEVLTGDDYGQYAEDRLSGMLYNGGRTTMWDTWDNRYGWSRQGLITAKSIMEMYYKPSRVLNCEVYSPNITWNTRFLFEELPGLRFVILRGEIGGINESFRGTLTEVNDDTQPPLPPGGNDGGNTVVPRWEGTGVTRCKKDESGANTGIIELVERDVNPASATHGQERWVDGGENLESCPIGQGYEILWGEQAVLNIPDLRFYPYSKFGDNFTVSFNGDDSNKILRLLHKADLGQVQQILYSDDENSLGTWSYDPDVIYLGEVYKSLKLEYLVGTFTNLNVTFVIN